MSARLPSRPSHPPLPHSFRLTCVVARRWTAVACVAVLAVLMSGVSSGGPARATAQVATPRASAPFLLAGGPGSQMWPHMAGNAMVYSSCRAGDCDVMGLDLSARRPFPIATGQGDEDQPDTDGYRVVWRDGRSASSQDPDNRYSNFDIYGLYLDSGQPFPVSRARYMQNRPAVWGTLVVWADFRNTNGALDQEAGDIYMYNLAAGKESVISAAPSAQVRPVTNGRYVVWADFRNEPDPNGPNSDIYAYDLLTGQEFPITTAPDTQTDPAISGNVVVWADWRRGDDTADIYAYNLDTKQEFAVATAKGSQIQPAISGNVVVWADFRNEPDPRGTNADIYGYDLRTKQEFPVYAGPGTQSRPAVSGNMVAWEDNSRGNSDLDIMGATIGGIAIAPPPAPPPPLPGSGAQAFPETGKAVYGIFFDYWAKNGGLARQGYPISEVMRETSDLDGKTYTVQYFERAVFEYHPENKPPHNVLLSQLGTFRYRQKYPNGAPGQMPNTEPGSMLFSQTGKWLGGAFLRYWQQQGGLAQFGYPISDEFLEQSDLDGRVYRVQYFERAVFEHHPENTGTQYEVLLSQLGTFRYKERYGPKP